MKLTAKTVRIYSGIARNMNCPLSEDGKQSKERYYLPKPRSLRKIKLDEDAYMSVSRNGLMVRGEYCTDRGTNPQA